MNLSKDKLTQLFSGINSVILRSGNRDLTVNPAIILETSPEGAHHRVRLMDALRTAVNGVPTVTPDDALHNSQWYSDKVKFIEVASMAVGQYNNN